MKYAQITMQIVRSLEKAAQADRNLGKLTIPANGRHYNTRRANYWARTWHKHNRNAGVLWRSLPKGLRP